MKKSLLAWLSVVFLSAPAYAQDDVTSSLLVPANAWLVGPTTLADGSAVEGGMPCVMVNKFSNNVEMRLSGGGEEILALALSVDEKPFQKDQSYLIKVGFIADEGADLPAEAFSENTLVIGLENGKDFYKSLQDSESLFVTLGAGKMEFSLLGVPQGLKRMEECYKPVTAAAAAIPSAVPVADVTGIQKLDPAEGQKINSMIDQAAGSALPVAEAPAKAEEKPVAPEKPLTPAPESAPKAVVLEVVAKQAPPPQQAKPHDILAPGASTAVAGEGQQMRWRVMKGANLQSIFEVWTQSAQARLIWNAGQGFSVAESLAMQGSFESAVEAVLSQFPVGQPRPVGKIYIDPTLKQKVLVIEADMPPVPPAGEGNYAPIVAP